MAVKIEKNVPMPSIKQRYEFAKMQVGDSIFTVRHIGATAYSWSKHNHAGKRRFITRKATKFFDARTNMELADQVVEQMKKSPLKKHLVSQEGFRTWRVE